MLEWVHNFEDSNDESSKENTNMDWDVFENLFKIWNYY